MTNRRSLAQRTAVLTVTAAAVLTVAGLSPAAADPPALNVDSCEQTLLRATAWPSTGSDGVRFVSDAYDYYLSRQAACTPGT
ncbi:MAG TPA: hypothetical protein VE463_18335 [Blastococcus sp.]|jgi:hypothetical protein|nr:hypothetical protein [Blastococcus sp.]